MFGTSMCEEHIVPTQIDLTEENSVKNKTIDDIDDCSMCLVMFLVSFDFDDTNKVIQEKHEKT